MKKRFITILTLFAITLSYVNAQTNYTVMPTNKKFVIQSALNYERDGHGCWDLPGSPTLIEKGMNLQVGFFEGRTDSYFTLVRSPEAGYYEISIGDSRNSRIDVAKGSTKNGTNIGTWEKNNSSNQRFLFKHLGDGRFKIYTRKGQVVCLAGQKNSDGTNVHIWEDHNVIATEWYLVDMQTRRAFVPSQTKSLGETRLKGVSVPQKYFRIQSALSYGRSKQGFWDLKGVDAAARRRGVNVQIWTNGYEDDQEFMFKKEHNSPYYKIYAGNTSNGVIDLSGGKTDNGTNVHIWEPNNSSAQDFYLIHLGGGRFKIYHSSGKIINLKSSNDQNGNNVQLWRDHNAIHCEWYLIDSRTNRAYIPR